ncbi:MAG: hypothetical protein JJD96_09800 [Thermoleophilia bacterium]|nr:hypothetical protein [Thermoleophilia bacterium]
MKYPVSLACLPCTCTYIKLCLFFKPAQTNVRWQSFPCFVEQVVSVLWPGQVFGRKRLRSHRRQRLNFLLVCRDNYFTWRAVRLVTAGFLRNGPDPLDRNIKLFPEDNSLLGNDCLDLTRLIMNDIGYLHFAYIFLPQITFIGVYDHADLNFSGLFLGALTGLVNLLRSTISIRFRLRRLLTTHSETLSWRSTPAAPGWSR